MQFIGFTYDKGSDIVHIDLDMGDYWDAENKFKQFVEEYGDSSYIRIIAIDDLVVNNLNELYSTIRLDDIPESLTLTMDEYHSVINAMIKYRVKETFYTAWTNDTVAYEEEKVLYNKLVSEWRDSRSLKQQTMNTFSNPNPDMVRYASGNAEYTRKLFNSIKDK